MIRTRDRRGRAAGDDVGEVGSQWRHDRRRGPIPKVVADRQMLERQHHLRTNQPTWKRPSWMVNPAEYGTARGWLAGSSHRRSRGCDTSGRAAGPADRHRGSCPTRPAAAGRMHRQWRDASRIGSGADAVTAASTGRRHRRRRRRRQAARHRCSGGRSGKVAILHGAGSHQPYGAARPGNGSSGAPAARVRQSARRRPPRRARATRPSAPRSPVLRLGIAGTGGRRRTGCRIRGARYASTATR